MQKLQKWRTTKSREVFKSQVLELLSVRRETSGKSPRDFVVLDCPDWVNVVALTPEGEMVMIRQFRQGVERVALEVPGGMVDPGEGPAQAAARELREETGYRAGELTFLGKVSPNPALFTNTCHTYLARDVFYEGPPRLDDAEQIEVFLAAPDQVREMVRGGEIDHSLVIAALCFFWLGESNDNPAAPAGLE